MSTIKGTPPTTAAGSFVSISTDREQYIQVSVKNVYPHACNTWYIILILKLSQIKLKIDIINTTNN